MKDLISVGSKNPWNGYGRCEDTTAAVDAAAEALVGLFGLPVVKGGSSTGAHTGGAQCGAFHDSVPSFSITVRHSFGKLVWIAAFYAFRERYDVVADTVPYSHIFVPQRLDDPSPSEALRFPFMSVFSPECETLDMAMGWLTIHGAKFNKKLATKTQGGQL